MGFRHRIGGGNGFLVYQGSRGSSSRRVAPGISARGSHRSVRKPLDLHGSCHPHHQTLGTEGTHSQCANRRVLRDTSKYYDLALITTDLNAPVEDIVSRYAAHWSIEVVFSQMRQILGVGQARNRTARAVERTVPFGLTAYTLVILRYARHGNPAADVAAHRLVSPWFTRKTEVSFQYMTNALRRVIIAGRFTPTSPRQATNEEILAVTTAWAQAA